MTTPEGKVKSAVKVLLARYGAYWHMPVQNGMGAPSLDFICCIAGLYFAVETKAGNGKMTERQEHTAERIRAVHGKVFVVNEKSGLDVLESWLKDVVGEVA